MQSSWNSNCLGFFVSSLSTCSNRNTIMLNHFIKTPHLCKWHHPYGRKQRGAKQPLDESERREWKSSLKIQHSKTKIMASSPITSWQTDGETMETVTNFIFSGSKITEDRDCSHEMKRQLLLRTKVMTNLDRIWKSRDIKLLCWQRSV